MTHAQITNAIPGESVVPGLQDMINAFRDIGQHDEFSALTNAILKAATELFDIEAAALLLVNKQTGELEIAAVKAVPEEIVTSYMQTPARANGLNSEYLPGSNPFLIAITNEPIATLSAAGYPHAYILPIRVQNKLIGYLTLGAGQPRFLTGPAQEKAQLFIEHIAQGIENAYFIFQLQQQNARLELMMAKLQNTQNHLKRAEKMALVGKLAATVAHEIRNPLTVIGTSLQLIHEKMDKTHSDYELFDHMIKRARSVDQTIKELLVFARPLRIEAKPLDLEKCLDRVIGFIQKKYTAKGITLDKQFQKALPRVLLDEEQMQRIFINLLLNAYEFVPEHGTVSIRVWHQANDPCVNMEFADNGKGIAREHVQQIFEPFFTTRADGNGLGLFMVKHLLEEMNASIEVNREYSNGAEFQLRLPIAHT